MIYALEALMKRTITVMTAALLLAAMLPAFLGLNQARSEEDPRIEQVKKNLPKMLGANNVGKEFWLTMPPVYEDGGSVAGFENYVKIFISSAVETQVTVEVPGKGYKKMLKTVPNDVVEVNIKPTLGQPYVKKGADPCVPEAVYPQYGIHVYAEQPLVVYGMARFYATSDGFLALPVSSLGKEYIISSYGDMTAMFPSLTLPSLSGIVAAYDDTKVSFTLGGNTMTKTAGGMSPGQMKSVKMSEGDVWMFSSEGIEADLSGSKVVASKPVAVISGNQCANIPTNNQWCDYIVEMEIPTFTWGTAYHVTTTTPREYNTIIKIYAKEPNTTIYRDGRNIGRIKTSGGMEGNGFMHMRVYPGKPKIATISGDKPIGVTQYNPGTQEDVGVTGSYENDPFQMVLTPIEQYQTEITFNTPGIRGGYGFANNYLNIVYQVNEYDMMPDDVEFAEVVGGQFRWEKVRTKFPGMDEVFVDVEGYPKFGLKKITLTNDGVYKIRADKPFAAYSYGSDWCDSYGYPTSAALADLEKPDTVCPEPIFVMACDGNVEGAIVTDRPDEDSVRSNLSMIVFHADQSENYKFRYVDFVPGETVTTSWDLTVVDPTQDALAIITFSDRAGNDTTIAVEYNAVKLAIRPEKVDFGLLKRGEKAQADFWAINESDQSEVEVTELVLKDGGQNFELLDVTLPFVIQPLDSIKFRCEFTAVEIGEYRDSIGIGDTCVFAYKSLVQAEVAIPEIEVTDAHFGDVLVNSTKRLPVQIRNLGPVDLVVTGYDGPALSEFVPVFGREISETNPLILTPAGTQNAVFEFQVDFTPTDVIDYADQIVFFNDAEERDSIAILTGRGIRPGLNANGYDWGRRRINRPDYPAGPYVVEGGEQVITLENTGTAPVYVENAIINVVDGDRDAFIFDEQRFRGITIQPQGTHYVEVQFQPETTGPHTLEITYNNDAGSDTKSTLKGIGIDPRISCTSWDFGEMIALDQNDIRNHVIKFTNEAWEYGSELIIEDLVITPEAADVNLDMNGWGEEGFQFDKAALGLPVTLQQGESMDIDVNFMAQRHGDHEVNVTSVSDCLDETTSLWEGAGIVQGAEATGGSSDLCLGQTDIIDVVITNTAEGIIRVKTVEFDPVVPEFTFVNPDDENGFYLDPHSSRTVEVLYEPTEEGSFGTTVVFTNDTQTDSIVTAEVSGTAVYYERSISVQVDNKTPIISQIIDCGVTLDPGGVDEDISKAEVKELSVTLTYNSGFLLFLEDQLAVGGDYRDQLQIQEGSLNINQTAGVVSLVLEAIDPNYNITGHGQILRYSLRAYLPTAEATDDHSDITAEVGAFGNECVTITETGNDLQLQRTCVYDIRKMVSIVTGEYSLSQVNPNPVSSGDAEIQFSVPFDQWTELRIYDSQGDLVAMPIAETIDAGEYSVSVPTGELSSGVYWYQMKSGPFSETKKFVVSK